MDPLTRLTLAADGSDVELARQLLDADPTLARARAAAGYTVLHTAVNGSADPEVIGLLLERGADPTAATDDGICPMHLARERAIPVLEAAGAPLDPRDAQGRTPLIVWAQERDGLGPLRCLLEHGADPLLVDGSGRDALFYQSERRATEGIAPLRSARAQAGRSRPIREVG